MVLPAAACRHVSPRRLRGAFGGEPVFRTQIDDFEFDWSQTMKVTIAMDNSVRFGGPIPLTGEHGASFLIEIDGKKILYDTGQTGAVAENLALLGTHPRELDIIVISHGHNDHGGGLLRILQEARKDVEVVMHEKAFVEHLSVVGSTRRSIGIPYRENVLRSVGGRWDLRATPRQLTPNLWFSGTVPRVSEFEEVEGRLWVATGDGDVHDPIEDDVSLFCRAGRGLVVVAGCAHSGLVNTVRHGFTVTGLDRLQGWIGGTHLAPAPQHQQDKTIAQLETWAPEFIAANHCTGFAMMARLKTVFGERFIPAFVGETIEA
jgi:7,8-dihydropterin-6-yl-methyl-4-(beta-D-ribofuranosyl)aminobenzene 5'-phosphate synthase